MSISRRLFLESTAAAALLRPLVADSSAQAFGAVVRDSVAPPLEEFSYGDVQLAPGPAQTQFAQTNPSCSA